MSGGWCSDTITYWKMDYIENGRVICKSKSKKVCSSMTSKYFKTRAECEEKCKPDSNKN